MQTGWVWLLPTAEFCNLIIKTVNFGNFIHGLNEYMFQFNLTQDSSYFTLRRLV